MITVCPNCGQRVVAGFDATDIVHKCSSGNKAIDEEDVVVTGNWSDDSGTGTKAPQEVLMQGAENKLFGTRAGIEGEKQHDVTRRGARASTHRQRQRLTYINLKEDKLN